MNKNILDPIADYKRMINVDKGDQVLILEIIDNKSNLTKKLKTEMIFEDNSEVNYVFVLKDVSKQYVEDRVINIQDNVKVNLYYCIFTKKEFNLNSKINIGENSKINKQVIFFAKKDGVIRIDEEINFAKNDSIGEFKVNGFLKDKSAAVIDGTIKVFEKAKKSNIELDLSAYLFGKSSQAKLTPSLEINTNDIKASHSAKVSPILQDDLYYMKSRGITQKQAQDLVKNGIVKNFLSKINHKEVEKHIKNMLKLY